MSTLVVALSITTCVLAAGHQGNYLSPSYHQSSSIFGNFDEQKMIQHLERAARQLPSLWNAFTGQGLSRQIFDMVDIVTDVAMLTLLGIPILGLVALGATALSPVLGTSGRKKRDLSGSVHGFVDRAGRAFLQAKGLFDILSSLDEAFEKYDIKGDHCQWKAICEVHRVGKNSAYKEFGNEIIELIRWVNILSDVKQLTDLITHS